IQLLDSSLVAVAESGYGHVFVSFDQIPGVGRIRKPLFLNLNRPIAAVNVDDLGNRRFLRPGRWSSPAQTVRRDVRHLSLTRERNGR
ncbi:MAG: hypothetical protein ACE5KM_23955, partial [Planctomycetaceae bacterium]